jgi:Family of unknown function (DUF6580)
MQRSAPHSPAATRTPESHWRIALAVCLIFFGAAMTWVDHPWNITPMGAIALFAGACLLNRRLAVGVPIAALVISDLAKTLFDPHWGYTQDTLLVMVFKYLGFVGIALCGQMVRRERAPVAAYVGSLAGAALGGAVLFFLVSNFGCWLTPLFGYEQSASGLLRCYAEAIPFFRAMLLGDLIYVPLLFGAFALAERTVPALAPAQAAGK